MKQTLEHILNETTINFDQLQLILMQACEVVNNRPLGVKMLNEEDFEVITCNQLLMGHTTTVLGEQGEDELLLENLALLPKCLQYCSELAMP